MHGKICAQPGNLIYNGNFETWDTAFYPQADLGDSDLCKLYNGAPINAKYNAFQIKGLDCVRWLPYLPEFIKYRSNGSVGGLIPAAYKVCYPDQYTNLDFRPDTDLPLKGSETFIGTGIWYDTINNKYTGGKFFLYLPLKKALTKGKTYKLDFDIKTRLISNICHYDTTEAFGCQGFGFGFTEKKPDFIQNASTYETDLVPEIKLGFFNNKYWTSKSNYFIADSNYSYIIIGYFDKGMSQQIYTKHNDCDNSLAAGVVRSSFMLDNLFLKEINDTLLPKDTSICHGKVIVVPCLQNKPVSWVINSVPVPGVSKVQNVITGLGITTVIASDSIISDTMYIHAVPYPQFNILQTDTLCNEISAFSALPKKYKYLWLPENIYSETIQLAGDAPRKVIGIDSIGCADTLNFIPIIGTGVCGTYFIPSAFTPNNDGTNDVFTITGSGIQNIEMRIFNIWGEEIFAGNGDNTSWNGLYQNKLVPQGIYLYMVEVSYYKNGKIVKAFLNGTLSLLR